MRNALIVLVLALCAIPRAFATPQAPDILVYEGESFSLCAEVLGPYFEEHPEKRVDSGLSFSTACYRGYIATFAIESGQLLFKDIQTALREEDDWMPSKKWPSVMNTLAPTGGPLPASWCSGFIRICDYEEAAAESFPPATRQLKRVVLLEIVEGRVVSERLFADLMAFEDFEKARIRDGKKSEAGKAYTESLRKKGLSDGQIADRLKGENGRLGAPLYRANNACGCIGEGYM